MSKGSPGLCGGCVLLQGMTTGHNDAVLTHSLKPHCKAFLPRGQPSNFVFHQNLNIKVIRCPLLGEPSKGILGKVWILSNRLDHRPPTDDHRPRPPLPQRWDTKNKQKMFILHFRVSWACYYRTQVSLGSDLWVWFSLTDWERFVKT